jgi:hypothetical protein
MTRVTQLTAPRSVNVAGHYWIIGGSTTEVYSSASNTMVPVADADYVAWCEFKTASSIASEAELADVLQTYGAPLPAWLFNAPSFIQPAPTTYSKDQLVAYNADARWRKEQGGLTLTSGMPIETDDRAQAKISGVMLAAKYPPVATKAPPGGAPAFTTQWHAADGSIWHLDAAMITAMSGEYQTHINLCFAASQATLDGITNGTVTTLEQIDAAYGL